jgi:hypothetical protein
VIELYILSDCEYEIMLVGGNPIDVLVVSPTVFFTRNFNYRLFYMQLARATTETCASSLVDTLGIEPE